MYKMEIYRKLTKCHKKDGKYKLHDFVLTSCPIGNWLITAQCDWGQRCDKWMQFSVKVDVISINKFIFCYLISDLSIENNFYYIQRKSQ